MDNKYKNGKIYKLTCDNSPLIYYGSTCQKYLSSRLVGHKNDKACTSKELFQKGNVTIHLIEKYPCTCRKELEARERIYIEFMLNNFTHRIICNKCIPTRTKKQYRLDNKYTIKEKDRQYHLENRDKLNEKSKKYRKDNKDILNEKKREKFNCECGSTFTRSHKSRHLKSKKHLAYIKDKD